MDGGAIDALRKHFRQKHSLLWQPFFPAHSAICNPLIFINRLCVDF